MKLVKDTDSKVLEINKVSDKEAEEAFKTILTWLGEDPNREGLLETPKRVMKAYKEYFSGYKIDPNKIVLYGEGTGGYISLAYNSLDKYSEISLPQFLNPLTQKSFVDTTLVGRIDGSGIPQSLTLYGPPRANMDVAAVVAAGGALADTSWLEAGDKPIIAIQCIRDPFAPFNAGTVIVPTTQEDVVDVTGSNIYMAGIDGYVNNHIKNSEIATTLELF